MFDCHAKTMTLAMLGFPRLERRGSFGYSTCKVISLLKAQHMAEKGCLAYFAFICDSSGCVPPMD